MINKVILLGNTGKDPEIKEVSGTKLATFSIATTETYKDKSGEKKTNTEWHNVEAWGTLAGIIEKYVKKGDKLYLEGKITYQTYEKDGQKHTVTKIRISEMKMLSGKPEKVEVGTSQPAPATIPAVDEYENTDGLPF
jgi:single-strand DNA-binding protein